ncbi:hypothetical protein AHAS_Ahas16G0131100 [Arachis hypogaea]
MSGPIASGISFLKNLTDLRISDLKGPDSYFPPLSNLTNLQTLVLRSCNLIGSIPEYFGNVTTLNSLIPSEQNLPSKMKTEFNSRMAVTHVDLEPNTGKTCLMSSKTGVFLVLVTILLGLSSFTLYLIAEATRSQDHGIGFITHLWWTLVPCGQFYYYYFLHCQKILKNKIEVCAMKFNVLVTTYEFIMALAPLSNDSGSKPDLLGSSGGGGSVLESEAGLDGEGELEGEEEKNGKQKEESALAARSESEDMEATAAATAAQVVNLDAAMASEWILRILDLGDGGAVGGAGMVGPS